MDKKKKLLVIGGSIVSLLVLYFIYEHFMYVTTDNAQIEAHSVMLASKVSGYVVDVKVKEGQKVKAGEVLVQIDPRDYQNTVNQMKAELSSLEARRSDAEKNFSRLSTLYSTGAVSKQQYETATASYSEVKAKYHSVSAQVSQAELNLENTQIKAPRDGFIAKKAVEKGQLSAVGVPLIGFIGADERWITANFKETDIENIKPGHAAYIDVDAISGKSFHGHVESISAATGATFTLLPPDNATGNFTKVVQRVPVKIVFDDLSENDLEILRAGLSTFVKVRK